MTALNQQNLGENDEEEEFQFLPSERKVITSRSTCPSKHSTNSGRTSSSSYPIFSASTFGTTLKQPSIKSLLLNIPIPVLYFAETEEAKYEIFDGHQRVRSIVNYLNGLFPLTGLAVLREYRGKKILGMPEREQRFIGADPADDPNLDGIDRT